MPQSLFGTFTTNGKGGPEAHKGGAKPAKREPEVHKSGAKVHTAVPKGETAKPGKRTPTKKEKAWMDAITRYGCIACRIDGLGFRAAAVHHILRGGQRMGHLFTLPLCDPGHHQNPTLSGMVARHPTKARFEKKYGTEAQLLKRLRKELKL
jgi:hypothetical protein